MSSDTLIISRPEIAHLLDPVELMGALREAFAAYSTMKGPRSRRFPSDLPKPAPNGASAMVLMPGLVEGIPAYTVKVHAKMPGLDPAIQGVIILNDLATGHPLAILESTLITAMRTGLSGALAADVLARKNASRVAIVGAGVQAGLQIECLMQVRSLGRIAVFDTMPGRAEEFAQREAMRLDLDIAATDTLEEAVADADIIVTATWATEPFLFMPMIKKGSHITALGSDQPGKREIDAALLRQNLFVCDDRELVIEMGAIGNADLPADVVDAELGEIISGASRGRISNDQITVFGGVGLPFQDLVLAWQVYRTLRNDDPVTRVCLRG